MSNSNPQQEQINIELDEKTAEGIYSNLAIINHSSSEFVLDFIGENIHRFEVAHGEIKDTEQAPIPLNFGPAGQA